jgi:hypothetical protein
MYRDLVVDEVQRLVQVIARLLGLKTVATNAEFAKEFDRILRSEYDTGLEKLISLTEEDFNTTIEATGYSSEKLNDLSQMLYAFATPFKADDETQLLLKKVLAIFDLLEQKYHYQSFENIYSRKHIARYFKGRGLEVIS